MGPNRALGSGPGSHRVIDRDFKIVEANRSFTENYGDWKARPCYSLYKDRTERCDRCAAAKTFADGLIRVREELGVVIEGTQTYYLVRTVPLLRHDGCIPYIMVLIVTAHARDELGRRDLEDLLNNRVMSGPGTYLEKPVSPAAYVRAIQRSLGVEPSGTAAEKINLKEELQKSLQGASPEAMRRALEALKNVGKGREPR